MAGGLLRTDGLAGGVGSRNAIGAAPVVARILVAGAVAPVGAIGAVAVAGRDGCVAVASVAVSCAIAVAIAIAWVVAWIVAVVAVVCLVLEVAACDGWGATDLAGGRDSRLLWGDCGRDALRLAYNARLAHLIRCRWLGDHLDIGRSRRASSHLVGDHSGMEAGLISGVLDAAGASVWASCGGGGGSVAGGGGACWLRAVSLACRVGGGSARQVMNDTYIEYRSLGRCRTGRVAR